MFRDDLKDLISVDFTSLMSNHQVHVAWVAEDFGRTNFEGKHCFF
jgi:hypothetical protein